MSGHFFYPVPMWASDILEALDRRVVYEGADVNFHDADAEFSKQAKREMVYEIAGEDRSIYEWMPGWTDPRRRGNRGGKNRQHVLFAVKDDDELRGRLAVLEVMGT